MTTITSQPAFFSCLERLFRSIRSCWFNVNPETNCKLLVKYLPIPLGVPNRRGRRTPEESYLETLDSLKLEMSACFVFQSHLWFYKILDFPLHTDPQSLWEKCPSPHSLWVSDAWDRERELPPFSITSRTLSRVQIETCKTSALPKGMMSNFLIYPPLPLPFPPKKKKRRRTHPKSNLSFWSKHLD